MDSHFLSRRIHSLTGIIPVGLFLVYHLYLQLYLHAGEQAYNQQVNAFYESPLAVWVVILLVYLPLIFHSVLGLKLTTEANVQPQYVYFSHLLYWLQRLSGVGVFFFILGHLYNAKLVPWVLERTSENDLPNHFNHLTQGFANPDSSMATKTVYVLGILGATFHLANGINTFCMTWGIALTPKSQARVRVFSMIVFVALTASAYYALSAIW